MPNVKDEDDPGRVSVIPSLVLKRVIKGHQCACFPVVHRVTNADAAALDGLAALAAQPRVCRPHHLPVVLRRAATAPTGSGRWRRHHQWQVDSQLFVGRPIVLRNVSPRCHRRDEAMVVPGVQTKLWSVLEAVVQPLGGGEGHVQTHWLGTLLMAAIVTGTASRLAA